MAPSSGDSTTRRGSPSAPAEDTSGNMLRAVTYIAEGNTDDGCPSFRYITLLRERARAHGLPEYYIRFLEQVDHAAAKSGGGRL
jgi:hypothetical protein